MFRIKATISLQKQPSVIKKRPAGIPDYGGIRGWSSPIEAQYLSENQDQNHAYEYAALVHVSAHALVTDNTNAIAGRETCHTDGNTAGEMHETAEQAITGLRVEVLGDEDGYDEGVDRDDTGHDDGNEALWDGTRSV